MQYLATFLVGLLGSIASGIVGGGGSLFTAPYLIFIGLPPATAVATTKCGSVGVALGALQKFWKSGKINWNHVPYKVVLAIASAILGPQLLRELLPTSVPVIVGGLMLVSALFMQASRRYGLHRQMVSAAKETVGYIMYFGALTLQSAFGAGIGMLRVMILVFFFGLPTLEAQATARTSGVLMTTVSLLSFIFYGMIDFQHGLALFGGGVAGGYIGTHIALIRGNRFVRALFSLSIFILGLILVWRSL